MASGWQWRPQQRRTGLPTRLGHTTHEAWLTRLGSLGLAHEAWSHGSLGLAHYNSQSSQGKASAPDRAQYYSGSNHRAPWRHPPRYQCLGHGESLGASYNIPPHPIFEGDECILLIHSPPSPWWTVSLHKTNRKHTIAIRKCFIYSKTSLTVYLTWLTPLPSPSNKTPRHIPITLSIQTLKPCSNVTWHPPIETASQLTYI